ncbi:MAG: C69 family dipeptidase, partial [Segatella salivae]
LIYLALQRSKTAREAIRVMTTLVNTYGYYSAGETFTICDANEAWIMEMMGKGPGSKGAVWVAVRIPDNAICAHANQSRITTFMHYKKGDVMYAKDVVSFARSKGWYTGKDKDFSWRDVYATPTFGGRRYCDARVWSFFNRFSDGFDRYLPWAMGKDNAAKDMPLWIIPNRKVSLQDVEAAMRDHYEGTPMALDTTSIGGGVWQMPYRPTPLSFIVDGRKYFNERPISTQQTAFSYVAQLRAWLPREIGGVLWFGNDDGNMVPYTPIYCGNTVQPECYNTPGADAVTFSDKNAYWICNWVSNMVYPRYSQLFPTLQEVRDSLDNSYILQQASVEQRAQELYRTKGSATAVQYLNDYSNRQAQSMLAIWKELATFLIVKYNDMAVKPTKGRQFLLNREGLGAKVARPGFPESFARKLVKETGDHYAIPTEKE